MNPPERDLISEPNAESGFGSGSGFGPGSGPGAGPRGGNLTAEQLARVHEIFSAAVDYPKSQREGYITAQCQADEQVRSAVCELLAIDGTDETRFSPEQGGLVPRITGAASPGDGAIPAQFGQYRIQRLIGKGGMGVVYLATQANPQRHVALKILASSAPSHSLRVRFAREIDLLGRLDDPGIARIFEAGTQATPSGLVSYFAMEYVQGPRLTDFANQQKLSIAARIDLVAKVADALHHAHTKGVLHRDLKPANILVASSLLPAPGAASVAFPGAALGTGLGTVSGVPATKATGQHTASQGPQPKILDFGVARLLETSTQHTALTEAGLLIGTVAYMSPEQLSGDQNAIDTRSDIYSLGVVLYELIANRLPSDVLTKPIAEAARIIRDDPPAPLTTANGARIDHDLATIVAKAMHKERDRRYSSAAALADDLRRWLRGETIAARPATVSYQLSRFARRNRGLVAAVAIATLATVAGLVISLSMYVRAQRASERATKEAALSGAIREYMIEGLLLAASPGRMGYEVKMMDVLAKAADGLHERFAENPEIEAEVRYDLAKVFEKLGKNRESLAELELVLPLVERTSGQDSERAIDVLASMAQVFARMQQPQRSLELAREGVARAKRGLPATNPAAIASAQRTGIALHLLGRHDEALATLTDVLATLERAEPRDEHTILTTLNWLLACETAKGNAAGALERTRDLADRTQKLWGRDNDHTLAARNNLVSALVNAKLLDEAAAAAVDLPEAAERTFPPGHPARAYLPLTAANAMLSSKRYQEAAKYGLMAHAACLAAFDDVNWTTEKAAETLRRVHTGWKAQPDELRRWALQGARIRLMVANADERPTTLKTISDITADLTEGAITLPDGGLPILLWQNRDTLAPMGHERRAVFMGNLACVMAALNQREHFDDALAAARESLATAKQPAVAQALLAAAEILRVK